MEKLKSEGARELRKNGFRILGVKSEWEELPKKPFGAHKWIVLDYKTDPRVKIPNLGRMVSSTIFYEDVTNGKSFSVTN